MITKIRSGAVDGIEGFVVTVEVDASRGLPAFQIVGLPSAAVRESRERVLAAVRNSGFPFPAGRVTVNLAPADIRKEGASFDLAIAVGVIATQAGPPGPGRDALLLGELSLFGELRPVRGLLSIVLDAAARRERTVVVPAAQAWEARLAQGVEVIGAETLAEVVAWWREGTLPAGPATGRPRRRRTGTGRSPGREAFAFLGLIGQREAKRAAVIAAAGGHNLLLIGPPGTGKTRLARAVGGLQPALDDTEALEVTRIHSAAGTLRGGRLLDTRPFRAPHHTTTRAGLIGGGNPIRPGEVTLAHRGVLFLDELAEFGPAVLDALREPLEEGQVAVSRGGSFRRFPAAFQMIGAMNPCRCGFLGSKLHKCRCTPASLAQYRGRLSGPFLDRIDLFVEMTEHDSVLLSAGGRATGAANSNTSRPEAGPGISLDRWCRLRNSITRVRSRLNCAAEHRETADADPRGLVHAMGLDDPAIAYLEEARGVLGLSIRGVIRCARVARTIARLAGADTVARPHVAEALSFRLEALPGFQAGPDDE